MSSKYNRGNKEMNFSDAPANLDDHVFYGLSLDEEQKVFRDAIYNKDTIIVICNSRAGTGKSTIALGVGNLLVQYGKYNGILYIVFPTMEQRQGYLPGDQEAKTAPYIQPLLDAMHTLNIADSCLVTQDNMRGLKEGTAYIEYAADTYLRGVNFENKVVIIEEAQNAYQDTLKKVLTRIHDNCKVIMIGHSEQCDLYKNPQNSGFVKYINAFKEVETDPRVAICELHTNHRGWLSTFCDDVKF